MPAPDWIKRAYRPSRDPLDAAAQSAQPRCAIMIVDDNIKIIAALGDVLGRKYKIIGCGSAAEVEQRFSDEIKLVLLDIKMAPDDGMVIFSLLRRRSAQVPILFHTAHPGNSEALAQMRELCADGFLLKGDYSLRQLEETIERALTRSLARRTGEDRSALGTV